MSYYKDTKNGLHFLDDAAFAYMLPDGSLEITDTEARAAQAAANEPSPEQVLAATNSERDSLLATASLRIAPLQDAVDLGTATSDDTANLKLWKEYRVAVNRVSTQTGFPTTIDWPAAPES
ncbi:tail fiber assembly protein [Pseudomonas gingeri]|uniref:tail fiber assembly protein n=1 Tax=Pseudomonas gingeri TaxID=117681 RepID=UPI0015A0BB2C|nr:tail fiber assembly protein [Pseudomonas gingeri]NVZ27501.1 tail fiber assembly protein [Pseudomonas gingeri]